jgi:uncharacterized protein YqfA (UPF0365 family)
LVKGLSTMTGERKDPFYSAVETLSWHSSQHATLRANLDRIVATGGFPAKSLLINVGEKPVETLFSKQARKKGTKVNEDRRKLKPTP